MIFNKKVFTVLILLIPLSVFGKTYLEQYQIDLRKSGCQAKHYYYSDEYFSIVLNCELINLNSYCHKYAEDSVDKFTKECVKEYQDKSWWKKLL